MHAERVRLDRWLRQAHPHLSWRQVRGAIEKGQVMVDGRVERDPGLELPATAHVDIDRNRPAQSLARARFDILHEDEHVLVLDKPAGLLTIPASPDRRDEDTVLGRVREYMARRRGRQGYVGMLHRLDRDASGALVVALSSVAHAKGRELFKHHRFERRYLALVQGVPDPPQGTIAARVSTDYHDGRRTLVDDEHSGLDATTDYRVREAFAHAALVELQLHTGRQHQIRLHLEQLGHPLVGERVYADADRGGRARSRAPAGSQASAERNMLHAWTLAFPHPMTGAPIAVEARLPRDFETLLGRLRRSR